MDKFKKETDMAENHVHDRTNIILGRLFALKTKLLKSAMPE